LGSKRVEICYRSFDIALHRKKKGILKDQRFDAGFVGSYEEEREIFILYLIENGIKVSIVGDGWNKGKYFDNLKQYYLGPSVYGELYVDAINSMKIALHFLRVGNRDEQDSRTFEIPACGTPMIAEYSDVHQRLFQPDHEVLFFRNKAELLDKVKFLMKNPDIAEKIAERAMQRCMISGYDHQSTISMILKKMAS
jgi:glycosyltransferase involved in cell wall biosynthesis